MSAKWNGGDEEMPENILWEIERNLTKWKRKQKRIQPVEMAIEGWLCYVLMKLDSGVLMQKRNLERKLNASSNEACSVFFFLLCTVLLEISVKRGRLKWNSVFLWREKIQPSYLRNETEEKLEELFWSSEEEKISMWRESQQIGKRQWEEKRQRRGGRRVQALKEICNPFCAILCEEKREREEREASAFPVEEKSRWLYYCVRGQRSILKLVEKIEKMKRNMWREVTERLRERERNQMKAGNEKWLWAEKSNDYFQLSYSWKWEGGGGENYSSVQSVQLLKYTIYNENMRKWLKARDYGSTYLWRRRRQWKRKYYYILLQRNES